MALFQTVEQVIDTNRQDANVLSFEQQFQGLNGPTTRNRLLIIENGIRLIGLTREDLYCLDKQELKMLRESFGRFKTAFSEPMLQVFSHQHLSAHFIDLSTRFRVIQECNIKTILASFKKCPTSTIKIITDRNLSLSQIIAHLKTLQPNAKLTFMNKSKRINLEICSCIIFEFGANPNFDEKCATIKKDKTLAGLRDHFGA